VEVVALATMDVGPVRLFGAFETPRGRRCRAYWRDGTLYVVQARDDVTAIDVPAKPTLVASKTSGRKVRRTWEATTAGGETVSITEEGCASCGFTLMSIPASTIPRRVPA
jgi:hypothetical protein